MNILYIVLLSSVLLLIGCSDSSTVANTEEKYAIGDLGGVSVDLPREFVELIEYDGDPSWGEKRVGKKPERTYQSKINSFGFDIRYTDKTLLDSPFGKLADIYHQEKKLPENPWVSVGINSGDRYYGLKGIDRMGKGKINPIYEVTPRNRYEKLPEKQYGLEVYSPPGIDPKTNKPWREDSDAEDVFIKRDDNGTIVTYINCTNRQVIRPPCTQRFSLEPTMQLNVYASYSRWNLADWQRIQQVATETILSFRRAEV